MEPVFDWNAYNKELTDCRKCSRLVSWREQIAHLKKRAYCNWEYWGKPVPGFGDPNARLLILGLAPGAHGSNRTGRMFTGDGSGNFLFPALNRADFSNKAVSQWADDGLVLKDVFITAVCRCAPPANKLTPEEIVNCRPFLHKEVDALRNLQGIVALGNIAYNQALNCLYPNNTRNNIPKFSHGAFVESEGNSPWILASYHPSRQNTQTGKLTIQMFDSIWTKAKGLIDI